MKKQDKRRPLRVAALIVLFAGGLVFVLGLGVLRYHASRLAYYLESINTSIQKYSDEETLLRQELSAIIAPIKIYSYCKERLGMQKVLHAESIAVRNLSGEHDSPSGGKMARLSGSRNTWRERLAWLLGR